jgi:hypothetical protein
MNHFDIVTALLNSGIDNINYGLKQAPQLWHDDINAFLLSVELTSSSADRNLYLCSDGILTSE